MYINKYPSGQLNISDQIYHWPAVSTSFHPPNWSYSIPLNIACNRLLFLGSELHLSVWNLCQLTKNKENRKATTMFSGINKRKIVIVRKYKNLLNGFKESCVLVGHHPVRKYILLDVLVYNIVVYFYSFFVFWLALRARQNTAELVTQNIS